MKCDFDYGLVNVCAGLTMVAIIGTVAILIYLLDTFAFRND